MMFNEGDVVCYQDRANPSTDFLVLKADHENQWDTYQLRNLDTDEVITSDCRQSGWSLVRVSGWFA